MTTPDDLNKLKAALEAADTAYYENDAPIITDAEYDKLVKAWLTRTGEKWMTLGTPNAQLTRIPHLTPMLSLDKQTDIEALAAWAAEIDPTGTWVLTPKIDGLSGELRYQQDQLKQGVSRGDGTVGEAILHSLGAVVSAGLVPARLPRPELARVWNGDRAVAVAGLGSPQDLQVRGEIYLPTDKLAVVGGANCRNVASGLVRRQRPDVRQTHLRFAACRVVSPAWDYTTQLQWLAAQGFEIPPYLTVTTAQLAKMTITELYALTEGLGYETDGIVIAHNSHAVQAKLGETSRYPRWAVAFKFETEEVETEYISTEWNASRVGFVVPTHIFKAVRLCGTVVTRATGHNLGQYQALGAQPGDRIVVAKANEIIPEVRRVVRNDVSAIHA